MDKNEVITKVEQFARTVSKKIKVKSVILFGSYANGVPREDSDIDVAVIVDKIEGDFLDTTSSLYKIRRDIDYRIEPVLFELGDDDSGFLASIIKNGRLIA